MNEKAAAASTEGGVGKEFELSLDNFSGPFDLLLSLITKREMDITEIALSAVTAEFIEYIARLDLREELDQASEFLVVAATLLDLKVAGLLPRGEVVDPEDVALLEARDLLFARLLQYRAFKEVSAFFASRFDTEGSRHSRQVPLDTYYREKAPELIWNLSLADFAALAAFALAPKEIPMVKLEHLHAPLVSIREQAAWIVATLRTEKQTTFRHLITGLEQKGVVVARFIAVLELYGMAALTLEQLEPLGELTIRWNADNWNDEKLATLGADYEN